MCARKVIKLTILGDIPMMQEYKRNDFSAGVKKVSTSFMPSNWSKYSFDISCITGI